ncbi:MAG: exopolysaccharide biosynthesis polyprenyl glycosylphosphotransferase [Verrucomicrobiae bacterium]|nr:exopolysaccharide biosynthesis polyprenyl glycosylphosphotransferase [Verrucomicrobiae bacterium]
MSLGVQRQSKHLRWAGFLFLIDFLLVWGSFLLGIRVRFEAFSWDKLADYGPGIGLASLVLPSILYIGGLYSPRHLAVDRISHLRWLLFGVIAVNLSVLAAGSLVFTSRVGRGVLLASMLSLIPLLLLRYWVVMQRRRQRSDSLLCLVASEADEQAALKLHEFWGDRSRIFAIVAGRNYRPQSDLNVAKILTDGSSDESLRFDVVLVRDSHFQDRELAAFLRGLRYEGSEILPLSDACEDIYHAVPLELITDAWLFRASNQSQLFYVRKLKRFSDLLLASLFLVLLSPFLALGALLVKISSPGPLIFRQERAGRLGRSITVLKLRTMHVDAAGRGERWANEEKDRIFPLGSLLRTFRVDEIPQLINVIRGEMSFVGPRPEQLSIVEELAKRIPFYRERLLIQPGITGWAQVNYPYGASVEDAARKLEYDLYYMKHMGIFLDFFILLETIKIILSGGRRSGDRDYLEFREDLGGLEEELRQTPPL